MREFTRITLRLLMCLFLLVGCGANIYYLSEVTDDNDYASYRRKAKTRHSVTYDSNGYNEYQQPQSIIEYDTLKVDLTEDYPIQLREFHY